MSRTPDDIVRAEMLCCMSGLVHTLAGVSGVSRSAIDADLPAWELFNAAVELAAPIDDWEEAAAQLGYRKTHHGWSNKSFDYPTARELCEAENIEPYQWEVFEHWAVSDWLADQLIEQGEKVDKDFAGLCVWARTTTGQMISMDGVFNRIVAAVEARYQEIIKG